MGGKVVMTMAEQFSTRATTLPRPVQVGTGCQHTSAHSTLLHRCGARAHTCHAVRTQQAGQDTNSVDRSASCLCV